MVNKNYARGFRAEDRCLKELQEAGYFAQRAHASKGCWDVLAIGHGVVRIIEVKRTKRPIVKQESIVHKYQYDIDAINEIPDQLTTFKELWLWIDKIGLVGQKVYHPAGWRKFMITKTSVEERPKGAI